MMGGFPWLSWSTCSGVPEDHHAIQRDADGELRRRVEMQLPQQPRKSPATSKGRIRNNEYADRRFQDSK